MITKCAVNLLRRQQAIGPGAEAKLMRAEIETRGTRQELQSLQRNTAGGEYQRRSDNSSRLAELRANLQKSTEQLQSDIKVLLTPQQRNEFDKQLRRPSHAAGPKSANFDRRLPNNFR